MKAWSSKSLILPVNRTILKEKHSAFLLQVSENVHEYFLPNQLQMNFDINQTFGLARHGELITRGDVSGNISTLSSPLGFYIVIVV